MIIGDRLREMREEKKLSQGDIEKRTGLLRCYISRVENGHTVPAIETLEKLARALECPLYQLFYEGEEPPKPRLEHDTVGPPGECLWHCIDHTHSISVPKKCHLDGVVVLTPFSAAFTLKHRECKQASARRRGGLLLRGSASYEVLVPPTSRAPSKKADLGTWELSHTRALRVVCLERLRASSRSRNQNPAGALPRSRRPPRRRALDCLHSRCLRVKAAEKGVKTTTPLRWHLVGTEVGTMRNARSEFPLR